MREQEINLTLVEGTVDGVPNVGDKCWFLPNPTGVVQGTVSARWTDGDDFYVTVNEWNPNVRFSLDKLIWEVSTK